MLQRIQSLYLLLTIIISCGLIFIFHIWIEDNHVKVYVKDDYLLLILFLFSGLLAFISLLKFKNRKLQFVMGRFNILLNLTLLGLFLYHSLSNFSRANISQKGIGLILPILSILCLVLANKAIKKDEDLIKSVDRIR